MPKTEDLHVTLKQLIVDTLALEDITAEQIETDTPLFLEGLGLDSIDALELAMALEDRYSVKIGDDVEQNEKIFASVHELAVFVNENRAQGT